MKNRQSLLLVSLCSLLLPLMAGCGDHGPGLIWWCDHPIGVKALVIEASLRGTDILKQFKACDRTVIPILAEMLIDSDSDQSLREAAGRSLAHLGPASVPALIEALNHQKPEIRQEAVHALGWIGEDANAAVPALTARLQDESLPIRWQAASSLGSIGAKASAAVPALTQLLDSPNERVRYHAATALGYIAVKLCRQESPSHRKMAVAIAATVQRAYQDPKLGQPRFTQEEMECQVKVHIGGC